MAKSRSTTKKKRRREEEEEAPRRRRRSRPEPEDYVDTDDELDSEDDGFEDDDEDSEDEPPRRRKPSRRRSRDDDDEDSEDSDDDDLDSEDDSLDDDEDSEDEEPRARRKKKSRSSDEDDIDVAGGWGEFQRQKAAGSKYPDRWKPEPEQTVVKFLDDAPFATYRQHWFNELKGVEGLRMGHVCLEKDCPACDTLGDTPGLHAVFNVVVFEDPDDPVLMVLDAGAKLGSAIEQHAKSDKTGPLTRHYYAISVTGGKGGSYNPQVQVIKERDLEEDWDVVPLSDDELDDFEADRFDKKSIDRPDPKALDEAVDYVVSGADEEPSGRSGRRKSSSSRKRKGRRR